jgi:hypothetical protein
MIFDNAFQLNIYQLAIQLLPTARRTPIMIAFVKVLATPFKKQLERLNIKRAENIYKLTHDARVGRVEKVLNDKYDVVDRRIRIGSGNRIAPLYIYQEAEDKQTYLPAFVYTQQEIKDRTTDFVVLVPVAIGLDANDLLAMWHLVYYYTEKFNQFNIEII